MDYQELFPILSQVEDEYTEEMFIVSARDIHKQLDIRTQFTIWINRMLDYGFVENSDLIDINQKRLTVQGNETTFIDVKMTINMAKELCMIQRTEKGRIAIKSFITIEKIVKKKIEWNEVRSQQKVSYDSYKKSL